MPDILAQATQLIGDKGLAALGAGLGVGFTVIGAAKGIGHLAGNAVESIARQPEAGGRVFVSMLLAAALIEGFTFFAIVTCGGLSEFLIKTAQTG
ncbi:MAG: ATP synthase F0 subunit C [Phycisphaerales bacterium]|nr:MAG: ATP synthase F0 subunit C [Phycisphaerales bacterium]